MAIFAKRHYEAVALALQDAYKDDETWALCVDKLADMFAADNPQFKPVRFVAACVPGDNVRART